MLKYHIQTVEVGAAGAATIDFNNIPQDYDDLYLLVSGRTTFSIDTDHVSLRFNGTSANQVQRVMRGDGSSAGSFTVSRNYINSNYSTNNTYGNMAFYISKYTAPVPKAISTDSVTESNAVDENIAIQATLWDDTSSIKNISIISDNSQSFVQYSSASLYGIKRGVDGVVEAAADGGEITQSGGYTIHTFTASGTFVANRDMDVEYVVVAGGGGAGRSGVGGGAGGGAGGYRCSVSGESSGGGASAEPKLRVSSGESFGVIVGAGGSGFTNTASNGDGASGSSSIFASITSVGGGGGSGDGGTASPGGSGGGGADDDNGAAGTVNQGFAGGNATSVDYQVGAGGGGASAVGGDGYSSGSVATGGAGGAGVASSITGSAVARAGGGGGGADYRITNTQGAGGVGGGGNASATTGQAGTANTGGGGGGSGSGVSGAGGSGIVIIRYLTPAQ